jgi:hypothetical protein
MSLRYKFKKVYCERDIMTRKISNFSLRDENNWQQVAIPFDKYIQLVEAINSSSLFMARSSTSSDGRYTSLK